MTSAIRDGRLKALSACSLAATLAASGVRMFSAAGAPGASDRRRNGERAPGNAASRAEAKHIHHRSHHYPSRRRGAQSWSRQLVIGFVGMRPFGVELCSICGTATNKPLTRPVTFRQPYLSVNKQMEPPPNGSRDINHTRLPGRAVLSVISLKLLHLSWHCCCGLQSLGSGAV